MFNKRYSKRETLSLGGNDLSVKYIIIFYNKIYIMNSLRNKVQLIGNLGADPEYKELESGRSMVKISLATSEIYKDDKGNKVKDTQWHHLVGWGKVADIAMEFLKKGDEIAVEGRMKHRSYEDKEGQTRYFTEVVIGELMMLRHSKSEMTKSGS